MPGPAHVCVCVCVSVCCRQLLLVVLQDISEKAVLDALLGQLVESQLSMVSQVCIQHVYVHMHHVAACTFCSTHAYAHVSGGMHPCSRTAGKPAR